MPDLSAYEIADDNTSVMQVMDPVTGEPLADETGPVTITVISEDSEKFRASRRKAVNRRLKGRGNQTYTAEQAETDAIEALVDATIGWSNISMDGQMVEFSRENVREVYRRLPWLVKQVDAHVTDRSNFIRASSRT
jgi:hypothetical protein